MNILPKKRWHVRTKENIARVRRDEAQAAEEQRQKEERALLAEQEARTKVLREKAKKRFFDGGVPDVQKDDEKNLQNQSGHVNFFQDLEDGLVTKASNEDYEKEKKAEKEEYEKKIGLLTYLGQNTNELTGDKSWWQKLPTCRKSSDEFHDTKGEKEKNFLDPLNGIRPYLSSKGVKNVLTNSSLEKVSEISESSKRKRSSSSDESDSEVRHKKHKKHKKKKSKKSKKKLSKKSHTDNEKLLKMREERLQREKLERQKSEQLMKKIRGEIIDEIPKLEENRQTYSSQFNPHLAKQNRKK